MQTKSRRSDVVVVTVCVWNDVDAQLVTSPTSSTIVYYDLVINCRHGALFDSVTTATTSEEAANGVHGNPEADAGGDIP